MQKLLTAIRTALPAAAWSRGVNLCREGRVAFLRPSALEADEVEAQVAPPQGGSAATVMLYPNDAEWDCDCAVAAVAEACAHAAAAAIALGQARAGKLPAPAQAPKHLRVRYVFVPGPEGLALRRELVPAQGSQEPGESSSQELGQELGQKAGEPAGRAPKQKPTQPAQEAPEVLAVPLGVRQRQPGPQVLGQASDLAVDALLAGRRIEGALGTQLLQRVLNALVDADNVLLGERPIQVGESTMNLHARVSARPGGGALLRGIPPVGLDESFQNGAGRFGRTLRPLLTPQLSERDTRALRAGQSFAAEEMPALLGEVLPRLARMLPVDRGPLLAVREVACEVRVALRVSCSASDERRTEFAAGQPKAGGAPEEPRTRGRGPTEGRTRGSEPAEPATHATLEDIRLLAQLVYVEKRARPRTAASQQDARVGEGQYARKAEADEAEASVHILGEVVGERLRATGESVPLRDAAAESRTCAQLLQELGLRPGHPRSLRGTLDVAYVARVRGYVRQHAAVLFDPAGALHTFDVRGALQPRWRAPEPTFAAADAPAAHFPRLGEDEHTFSLEDLGFGLETSDFAHGYSGNAGSSASSAGHVDIGAVMDAFTAGERYVAVPGGGYATVPGPLLAAHAEPLRAFLQAREAARSLAQLGGSPALGAGNKLPGWMLASVGALAEGLGVAVPPPAARAHTAITKSAAQEEANIEAPPGVVLRPYQRTGIAWLQARCSHGIGALLADDMGLGKTLQALLALQGKGARRVLVVAPTSVLDNWASEAARFRPGLEVATYHGPQRSLQAASKASWVLTSYGVLRMEAEALAAQKFDALVLDEAHVVKRVGTQVARAAFHLAAHVPFRLALTGTPLENRSEELWSLMHLLNPGILGDEENFARTYARPLAAGDAQAAASLRQRIAPVLLRRLKRDVAKDLPPRTDVVLRCELSVMERQVYGALLQATRKELVARLEAGESVMAALEALLRLRQAACHTGLVPGHSQVTQSSKLTLLLDSLQQGIEEGHRALVFSQWTGLLDRIEPVLRTHDIAYLRLDGSTVDRGAVVRAFSDAKGPPVLLMSLKAGGVGLNLTAADHVYLMDPWWNPAAEDQAADRANRIGQTRPVLVHRLISHDTVEEGILALQQHKRALADAALVESDAPTLTGGRGAGLTREDLLALFGGASKAAAS